MVETMKLDLSSLKSVRECADRILEKEAKLDLLVNNAGVMMTPAELRTEDGFDAQFGTNHLGHFLLTELLLPLIKKAAAAVEGSSYRPRIVIVSSLAHEFASMRWDDLNWEKNSYNKVRAVHKYKNK